ncbi:MAG: acetyl-CoA carboxylase, biotin carboxyl carrier protein [Magnetococcales bacterium]|nr:acetyl-CoA carboxylase, biotin carboxyl carrier protein [Magnetococcales bacterium]|tara:strand:+ start:3700 stop:4164 length:465 start_codon:yes stop_codon:yes gene_type:complete
MSENTPKFNLDYLKNLVDFMQETNLDEVEVSENGSTIRLRRNLAPAVQTVAEVPVMQTAPQAAPAPQTQTAQEPALTGHVVKSPMVGTFYRSPSPEASVFVNVGDRVKKGQVLCIIEAMKTMNQIESDKDGVVENILPENADPIEFGQPLFVIN